VWSTAFVLATVLGLSSALWVYFGMKAGGKPLTFQTAILAGLPDWYFWAALTPLVFWLGHRFPLERARWPRAGGLHLVEGAAIVLVELLVFTAFNHWFYYNPWAPAPSDFGEAYVKNVLRSFHYAFIIYWLIVVSATAFRYQRDSSVREREAAHLSVRNAELESELSRAQLEMLRAQLQPHFLFNALNAISGLVRERRNEAAIELTAALGRLLRQALATNNRDEISLREELDMLEAYLTVERARFRDRLRVHLDIEPAALDREVPSLILQPLVENAIRHGVSSVPAGGQIWISARATNGTLMLEVRDNGPGLDNDIGHASASAQVGLRNTRARLGKLYGDRCEFELGNAVDGGAAARIRLRSSR
jgi:two-component sensor histidine kinase